MYIFNARNGFRTLSFESVDLFSLSKHFVSNVNMSGVQICLQSCERFTKSDDPVAGVRFVYSGLQVQTEFNDTKS